MSQSLVVFSSGGQVLYQYNSKISAFNELVYSIANDDVVEHDGHFVSVKVNQKKFYCLRRDKIYGAISFDLVTTIDVDKIRSTLADVLKTFVRLSEEEEFDKLKKLIDYQFAELMQSKHDTPAASTPTSGTATPKKAPKKKMRKWVNGELVDYESDAVLDYLADTNQGDGLREIKVDQSAFVTQDDLVLVNELHDILDEEDDEEVPKSGFFAKLGLFFGTSAATTELSKKFREQLVSKNVHPSTAQAVTDRLETKLPATSSIAKYKEALIEELTKVLTPNVSTDLLFDIKKRGDRPYVISVVGVNGVGKSTNLAKLAYWLLQNNLNVLICACDTFRSGAVEQLKVHVNNLKSLNRSGLKIDLFEKGYGGGDHVVNTAKLAIAYGQEAGFDIVLIDTAGRTHSNAKLMAPLKKFGDAANPDKIIMVGEALVGTDSVEQATNFNNAFGNRRNLDFFIISKVDTVGDLVGTMINMVMATKVPILFMGTGQTYTDIKRLNVKAVVDLLTRE